MRLIFGLPRKAGRENGGVSEFLYGPINDDCDCDVLMLLYSGSLLTSRLLEDIWRVCG